MLWMECDQLTQTKKKGHNQNNVNLCKMSSVLGMCEENKVSLPRARKEMFLFFQWGITTTCQNLVTLVFIRKRGYYYEEIER